VDSSDNSNSSDSSTGSSIVLHEQQAETFLSSTTAGFGATPASNNGGDYGFFADIEQTWYD
jgi:hypothetical protein